ncbi:MAG: DUF1249 domain-containing protein [Gammaproteobacteria bacterium]|nr:DUF1249 domain-containing protein [Gammaproteobacteria bacterium]MCP4879316.1 DUF1249 domain-containing protein [Gammaproteobacteria bacterium]
MVTTNNLEKRRYVPNLTQQMATAEMNYHRLQRLMGCFDDTQAMQVKMQNTGATSTTELQLTIMERFAYTMTLKVQLGSSQKWWQRPIHVRLYHDMRMAEVVKSDDFRQYRGSYGYPNNQGVMADEKAQLNSYLALLLQQALQHGTHLQRHSVKALETV